MIFSIVTRTDSLGFWFRCSGLDELAFEAAYVAIGVANQHSTGIVRGSTTDSEWIFHGVGFRVLRVGFCGIEIQPDQNESSKAAHKPSRLDQEPPSLPQIAYAGLQTHRRRSFDLSHDVESDVFPQDALTGSFISHDPRYQNASSLTELSGPYPYPYPYPYPKP